MAHPEPTGSVLPVETYQPRAGGVEEAEDWHIPATSALRLDVEHAVRVDIRVGSGFTDVGSGGRRGCSAQAGCVKAAPDRLLLDGGRTVARDRHAGPMREVPAFEAVRKRKGRASRDVNYIDNE